VFQYGIAALSLFPRELYNSLIKYLGPHGPDGLLPLVIFAGVITAVMRGVEAWFAGLFGVAILGMFFMRRTAAKWHEERKAKQEVVKQQLELEKYRVGQRTKLEKEKIKRLPLSTSTGKVRK
jgi:hypothetical protein